MHGNERTDTAYCELFTNLAEQM